MQAMVVPPDIRLMNQLSALLAGVLALLLLLALLAWLVRLPAFAIAGVTVRGDVLHNNALTLRANVVPRLAGNFFTVDLAQARSVFESVPWVRRAVVQREFPNRLRVTLQEHQPAAFWGAEHESKLLNHFGEVFEANVGDVEREDLPRLNGPDGQSLPVLEMYRALKDRFQPLEAEPVLLELSGSGNWRLMLDSGASIELGRGPVEDITQRVERFVHTLTQVTSRYGRRPSALESADLRYEQGYALRLRGVTTTADPQKKQG
jgi:cell division protein FtsQ